MPKSNVRNLDYCWLTDRYVKNIFVTCTSRLVFSKIAMAGWAPASIGNGIPGKIKIRSLRERSGRDLTIPSKSIVKPPTS